MALSFSRHWIRLRRRLSDRTVSDLFDHSSLNPRLERVLPGYPPLLDVWLVKEFVLVQAWRANSKEGIASVFGFGSWLLLCVILANIIAKSMLVVIVCFWKMI